MADNTQNKFFESAQNLKRLQDGGDKANSHNNLQVDPEQFSKSVNLSKSTGIPAQVLHESPDEVSKIEAEQTTNKFYDALKGNPKLKEAMKSNTFMKMAHDDTKSLSAMESTINIGRSVVHGATDTVAKTPGAMAITYESTFDELVGRGADRLFDRYFPEFGKAVRSEKARAEISPQGLKKLENSIFEGIKEGSQVAKGLSEKYIAVPEDERTFATDVAQGLGQMSVQVATYIMNPTAGMALNASIGGEQQYYRATQAGADPKDRDRAVMAGAVATAMTEKFGIDRILGGLPKNISSKVKNEYLNKAGSIAFAGGTEAVQEFTEGVLHNLIAKGFYDPDAEIFSGLKEEAQVAGAVGGLARAFVLTALPGKQKRSDEEKTSEGISDAITLDNMVESAKDSKLLSRDVEKFEEHVKKLSEGQNRENVYIDGETVTTLYQSGADVQALIDAIPELKEQIPEAIETGTDIVIPTEKFISALAQNESLRELIPASRLTPDAIPAKNYVDFQSEAQRVMEEYKDFLEQDDSVIESSALTVMDDVFKQLVNIGYTPDVAMKKASLQSAFFETRAKETGQDAFELYRKENIRIQREGRTAGSNENLGYLYSDLEVGQLEDSASTQSKPFIKTAIQIKKRLEAEKAIQAIDEARESVNTEKRKETTEKAVAEGRKPRKSTGRGKSHAKAKKEAEERVGEPFTSPLEIVVEMGGLTSGLTKQEADNVVAHARKNKTGKRIRDFIPGEVISAIGENEADLKRFTSHDGVGFDAIGERLIEEGYTLTPLNELHQDEIVDILSKDSWDNPLPPLHLDSAGQGTFSDDIMNSDLNVDMSVQEIAEVLSSDYDKEKGIEPNTEENVTIDKIDDSVEVITKTEEGQTSFEILPPEVEQSQLPLTISTEQAQQPEDAKTEPKQQEPKPDESQDDTQQPSDDGVQSTDTSDNTPPEDGKNEPKKSSTKIEDFGEKIKGARKDEVKEYVSILSGDVDVATQPLSKSFPIPNSEKLIEAGYSRESVALVNLIRKQVKSKPRNKYKLGRWISDVESTRVFTQSLLEDPSQYGRIKELALKTGRFQSEFYMVDFVAKQDPSNFYRASDMFVKQLGTGNKYIARDKNSYVYSDTLENTNGWYTSKEDAFKAIQDKLDAEMKDKESGVVKRKYTKVGIYTNRGTGKIRIGFKSRGDFVVVKDGFADVPSARDYMREKPDEIQDTIDKMREKIVMRRDENRERVGEKYLDDNVSPETYTETFGFRGIQFGNWVENEKRHQELNDSFSAFMDLSGALGISPKAMSLNGELGVAFGSRGRRGAKAHYEADHVVINMTKKAGAGSLAHEWLHAFDNYISRMGGNKHGFVTDIYSIRSLPGVRPELFDAWRNVIKVINDSDYATRSKTADIGKSKAYYGTNIELVARAFEAHIIDKLDAKGNVNDYLANIEETAPIYPKGEERQKINDAFEELFAVVETRETEKGTQLFQSAVSEVYDPMHDKDGDWRDAEVTIETSEGDVLVKASEVTDVIYGKLDQAQKLLDCVTS